jgi:hypothetical protein
MSNRFAVLREEVGDSVSHIVVDGQSQRQRQLRSLSLDCCIAQQTPPVFDSTHLKLKAASRDVRLNLSKALQHLMAIKQDMGQLQRNAAANAQDVANRVSCAM